MNLPLFARKSGDGTILAIKLQPRASKNEMGPVLGSELKIKVTAAPVESAANEALIAFLSEWLDCPPGKVQLLRGHTSRHKTVLIQGLKPETLLQKLPVK